MAAVDEIIKVLDQVEDLPTLPSVYMRISTLIKNPKTSVSDVSRVIETDPAFTTKILRLVNSSFFGFNRQVVSIHQAVVLLGFNTIRNSILSVSVFDLFSGGSNKEFDLRQFWKHAITCGVLSTLLDNKLRSGYNNETFVAGLLHDIGKIILSRYFASDFLKALQFAQQQQVSFYEGERSTLGFSHDEIGEYMAEKWQLPFSLVETVALHHQPGNLRSNPKLVCLVHLADVLAYQLRFGSTLQLKDPTIDAFVLGELDIKENSLPDFLQEMQQVLEQSQGLFSMIN